MAELIRNLEEALEEMAKVGNQRGIDILEKALRQASYVQQGGQPE
tara:strand:- start:493 stop:627 length:135 start_codon:yes stop_codon:yes gene_type:complete